MRWATLWSTGDDQWKIPPPESGPSEKQNLQIHEVDDYEEQRRSRDIRETTQQTLSRTERKRKEPETGRYVPQWKKHKAFKEVTIQDLIEEYLENIGNQLKEVINDTFQRAAQQ
jgi:ABC-type oligopeptide transport system ATPase subunit